MMGLVRLLFIQTRSIVSEKRLEIAIVDMLQKGSNSKS